MRKHASRKPILYLSLSLLFLFTVGATLAYVFTSTNPVENQFNPSEVSCAVVENGNSPVFGSVVDIDEVKKDVKIKNTGDTDAYIRAAVIINWASSDGSKVWATKPDPDHDYTIRYILNNGWFDGGDGYYYYKTPVSAVDAPETPSIDETLTTTLIEEAKLVSGVTPPVGTDGTAYYLSIEIIASAIQSTPATTVQSLWGVTVNQADGTIGK